VDNDDSELQIMASGVAVVLANKLILKRRVTFEKLEVAHLIQ
jgi:hypothetical protein